MITVSDRWVLSGASGLEITDEQLEEMRGQVDNIDWAYAAKKEAEFRHDVMGHIHAFGHVCPKVRAAIIGRNCTRLTIWNPFPPPAHLY